MFIENIRGFYDVIISLVTVDAINAEVVQKINSSCSI